MISLAWRFVLYNLLPAIAIGSLGWLVVLATTSWMKIQYVPLRLPLLYVPLLKASLMLIGMSLLSWVPGAISKFLNILPIPPYQVLPVLLLWVTIAWLVQDVAARRIRHRLLGHAASADLAMPRLARALNRVQVAYHRRNCACINFGWACCDGDSSIAGLQLFVSADIRSPLITLTGGNPSVVFPLELAQRLTDAEIELALAHELAHLALRSPAWCSSSILARFIAVNPTAWLMVDYIRREEEMACDDIAIAALGQPDTYAEMLVKSYRFAARKPATARLGAAHRLFDHQPALSARVRRLQQKDRPNDHLDRQRLAACLLWVFVLTILFV